MVTGRAALHYLIVALSNAMLFAVGITPSLPQQQGEPVNDGADKPFIVTY